MLSELRPRAIQQASLFAGLDDEGRAGRLMAAMDSLNRKYGQGTLRVARCRGQHQLADDAGAVVTELHEGLGWVAGGTYNRPLPADQVYRTSVIRATSL